ncbi:MAG: flagellar hook-length control protein FliK [Ferrimicrobium sp.]|jgi:hypothetical protein|nr:flagellar hook-length control protein FliK [Ferrimicrobium sp.]
MSPVAKSASTPLLEAIPVSTPKAAPGVPKGAAQANGSSNFAETSFAQVQAQVKHQKYGANQHTPGRGIPVTTTLTPAKTPPKDEPPTTAKSAHVKSTRSGSLIVTLVGGVPPSAGAMPTAPATTVSGAGTKGKPAIPVGTTLTPMLSQAGRGRSEATGTPNTTSHEGPAPVLVSSTASTPGASRLYNQSIAATLDAGGTAKGTPQPTKPTRVSDEIASQTGSTPSSIPSSSATTNGLGVALAASGQTRSGSQLSVEQVQELRGDTARGEVLSAKAHGHAKVLGQAESGTNVRALGSTGRGASDASEQNFSQLAGLRGAVQASSASGGPAGHTDTALTPQSALATPLASGTSETIGSTPLGQLGTVVAQVVREGNLPRTITISLEPKELGQLQLQVMSNAGEIQVLIHVADPLTRGMVSAQLGDLTNLLNRDLGFGGQQTGNQGGHPEPGPSVPTQETGLVQASDALRAQPDVMPAGLSTHSLIDLRL